MLVKGCSIPGLGVGNGLFGKEASNRALSHCESSRDSLGVLDDSLAVSPPLGTSQETLAGIGTHSQEGQ